MLYILIVLFVLVGIYLLTNQKLTIKVAGGVTTLLGVLISDYTDLFSNLGIMKHININNYIELVASIIGGIIAFYIAKYQIEKTNEENKNNEKESLRIQNMPILKYEIDTEHKANGNIDELLFMMIKEKNSGTYELNLSVENIGNTTVRNINAYIYSNEISNKYQNLINNNSKNPMKSGDVININRFMELNIDNVYDFEYIIYYQDILFNWYKQIIKVKYRASNITNGNYKGEMFYITEEEKLISEDTMNNDVKMMMEAKKSK